MDDDLCAHTDDLCAHMDCCGTSVARGDLWYNTNSRTLYSHGDPCSCPHIFSESHCHDVRTWLVHCCDQSRHICVHLVACHPYIAEQVSGCVPRLAQTACAGGGACAPHWRVCGRTGSWTYLPSAAYWTCPYLIG